MDSANSTPVWVFNYFRLFGLYLPESEKSRNFFFQYFLIALTLITCAAMVRFLTVETESTMISGAVNVYEGEKNY